MKEQIVKCDLCGSTIPNAGKPIDLGTVRVKDLPVWHMVEDDEIREFVGDKSIRDVWETCECPEFLLWLGSHTGPATRELEKAYRAIIAQTIVIAREVKKKKGMSEEKLKEWDCMMSEKIFAEEVIANSILDNRTRGDCAQEPLGSQVHHCDELNSNTVRAVAHVAQQFVQGIRNKPKDMELRMCEVLREAFNGACDFRGKMRMKNAEKHCCGTCDLYSAKQIYPGVFGRCEWADRPPFCVGNMDVDFPEEEDGLTPEDGADCKAWRVK